MKDIAWELVLAILAAASILGFLIYSMAAYNMQNNRYEFEIQKVCIEGGGTYIRHNQQCLFPAMPAGKVTAQ